FAFCSSLLSPEENAEVGRKREQLAHRREVPRSSTMSPNDTAHDDAEGWCRTTMNYNKGRVLKTESSKGFHLQDLDLGHLDSSILACIKTYIFIPS
ncbi:hypothetical protein MTR67_026606, partial [Solanum verrucosum]